MCGGWETRPHGMLVEFMYVHTTQHLVLYGWVCGCTGKNCKDGKSDHHLYYNVGQQAHIFLQDTHSRPGVTA